MKKNYLGKKNKGFTLIEIIVGMAIFLIVAISAWEAFNSVIGLVRVSKIKVAAVALSNEQLEIVRNLPYADVGIIDGSPSGKLTRNRKIIRDGIPFNARFTVRNVDDSSDGTFPDDLSPADYKSVEIEISCSTCRNFLPLRITTTAAPKNLETASTNGALFIRALNANGQPVAQANVDIINNNVSPHIDIDETTDNNGWLQLVDVPPSIESYQITVSKAGYSTDRTYQPGAQGNPNPLKPHATVVIQQVTQITFVIDKVSALNVLTVDDTCTHKGYVDFNLKGAKLIGTNPNVYKYTADHQTNSNGQLTISNLEWDSYSVNFIDDTYLFAGSIPISPFALAPDSTLDLFLIVRQNQPKAILVKVRDASTLLPLSGAAVRMEKPGWDQTLISGRGYLRQTDWRGGSGQSNFTDESKYWSQDGNVNNKTELTLNKNNKKYKTSGWLISSTFDAGSTSNFYNLVWQPLDQDSGAEVKFQIATSSTNPPETWNFLGPDGTSGTYYTVSDTNINSIHNNDRYLRYKIFLSTTDTSHTPNVSDIAVTFSSQCIASGQAFFYALPASGNWTLTVSKDGYQTHSETIDINQDWQEKEIILSPSS
jgi:prepilin-type N-terminal cleavage/methylation domain-containing protein